MSRVEVPKQDAQFKDWVLTFASVASANVTALRLSPTQVTALTTLSGNFETAYGDSMTAKASAKGKVSLKDEARVACEQEFRSIAKVINANPTISSGLKADLGINVTPEPAGPVVPPIDLVANGFANGQNKLQWKRNGNANGTTFLIEVKYGTSGPWQFVGTTTKTRHVHEGQTPGQMATYRVFAQRDDFMSGASNLAAVYASSEVEVFTLNQAA